jgi:hypothetical protein
MSKFANGFYQVINPAKYVGKKVPHYRSSWEFAFMSFCDNNPSVTQWASEAIKINYVNPFTNRPTIYIPDFLIVYSDATGKVNVELIEIKPRSQTALSEAGRSKKDQAAAILNAAKWQAANQWAAANGVKFRIVTEDMMFYQGSRK